MRPGPGGVVAMCRRYERELLLIAQDRNRGIRQAGGVVGTVSPMRPAPVFVNGDVTDVMSTRLDVPVVAHRFEELARASVAGYERCQGVANLATGRLRLHLVDCFTGERRSTRWFREPPGPLPGCLSPQCRHGEPQDCRGGPERSPDGHAGRQRSPKTHPQLPMF